jgi:hypothetical protein
MRRWFYDELREPEVIVSTVEGSRAAQPVEATMHSRFTRREQPLACPRALGFANMSGICPVGLRIGCAASRAPHGARVD